MSIKTLVINPGSTSTKVGVFEDETLLFEETLRHPTEEIAKYASVIDQKDFRKAIMEAFGIYRTYLCPGPARFQPGRHPGPRDRRQPGHPQLHR